MNVQCKQLELSLQFEPLQSRIVWYLLFLLLSSMSDSPDHAFQDIDSRFCGYENLSFGKVVYGKRAASASVFALDTFQN